MDETLICCGVGVVMVWACLGWLVFAMAAPWSDPDEGAKPWLGELNAVGHPTGPLDRRPLHRADCPAALRRPVLVVPDDLTAQNQARVVARRWYVRSLYARPLLPLDLASSSLVDAGEQGPYDAVQLRLRFYSARGLARSRRDSDGQCSYAVYLPDNPDAVRFCAFVDAVVLAAAVERADLLWLLPAHGDRDPSWVARKAKAVVSSCVHRDRRYLWLNTGPSTVFRMVGDRRIAVAAEDSGALAHRQVAREDLVEEPGWVTCTVQLEGLSVVDRIRSVVPRLRLLDVDLEVPLAVERHDLVASCLGTALGRDTALLVAHYGAHRLYVRV